VAFRWRSLRPSFRWYRLLSFWQDTGHKLRTLSYFEFYRPCIKPLYIHKYPVSSAADQCPLTSLTSAPLDVSTRPRLFHDITGTDVKNLISSLRSNTPVFFAEALEASGAAGAAEDQQRAMYKPGDFVFGYEDVLGWIVRGAQGDQARAHRGGRPRTRASRARRGVAHRLPASAAIARELSCHFRYWPRVGSEQVVYGYRRETSTIIYAAVLHGDDVDLRP
jgi:hypothetical protein